MLKPLRKGGGAREQEAGRQISYGTSLKWLALIPRTDTGVHIARPALQVDSAGTFTASAAGYTETKTPRKGPNSITFPRANAPPTLDWQFDAPLGRAA